MASNVLSTEKSASGDVVARVAQADGGPRPCVFYGYSFRESAGTPAVAAFNIRTGGASGKILAAVELAANGSIDQFFGPQGVQAHDGLYFELVSGAVQGCVRHG